MSRLSSNQPEQHNYDPEVDPAPELPVNPKTSFFAVLFVLFLFLTLLKQTDAVDWSWWWICLPLWIVPVIVLVLAFMTLLATLWHEGKRKIRGY